MQPKDGQEFEVLLAELDSFRSRRPYDDSQPNGYQESDRDFLENNNDLAVALLEVCASPTFRRKFACLIAEAWGPGVKS
jgi:hypothetical protein